MNRRDFLKLGLFVPLAATPAPVKAIISSTKGNVLKVSPYGVDWEWLKFARGFIPYRTIPAALADITDAGPDNIYTLHVEGSHQVDGFKPYTNLVGRNATISGDFEVKHANIDVKNCRINCNLYFNETDVVKFKNSKS